MISAKNALGVLATLMVLEPLIAESARSAFGYASRFLESPTGVLRTTTLVVAGVLIFSNLVNPERLRRMAVTRLASRREPPGVDVTGAVIGVLVSTGFFLLALMAALDAAVLAKVAVRHPLSIEALACLRLVLVAGFFVLGQAAVIVIFVDKFDVWQNCLDRLIAEHPRQFLRLLTKVAGIGSGILLILSIDTN